MDKFKVTPSKVSGTIAVPSSKSHTLRAIMFGMMGKGRSIIRGYLQSSDSEAMINAIKLFGATVEVEGDSLQIQGVGIPRVAENVIDAGNSGQVLRFIGALAALSPHYTVITGDHSIRHNRPVAPLLSGLTQLGAFAETTRGDEYAPIMIRGPLRGGSATIDGMDSQPVSGLLIASAFAPHQTELFVNHPGETPWIDLTLHWLDYLGLPYFCDEYARYTLPGKGSFTSFERMIPGDMSSAAYPVAAALITGSEVTVQNVDMNDVQGDKALFLALETMGANLEFGKDFIKVKPSHLKGRELNINHFVDSITILAVLGCYAEGKTVITGASIARHKESDRIHAITTELKKMGASIQETEDGLIIEHSPLRGAEMKTYHDHRMVMSLTCAALGAHGDSVIEGVSCSRKTYPTFKESFTKLGAIIG
jgi:3-phosphoshikimate 1-carboxyvinyltransferase